MNKEAARQLEIKWKMENKGDLHWTVEMEASGQIQE